MPTNRRYTTQPRRTTSLDPDVVRELFVAGGGYLCDLSNDELRLIWQEHRTYLRQRWRAEHGPGSRCFAEWLFEIIPKHGERLVLPGGKCLIEHRDGWTKRGVLHTHLLPPGQEPQVEFLRRHGLLDEDEIRFFAKKDARHL